MEEDIMPDFKLDGFRHLQSNIESMIYESLVKLGSSKGEQMSIYYDIELLLYLLNRDSNEKKDIVSILKAFQDFAKQNFLDVCIEMEKGRYKFTLNSDAVGYIYNKHKDNTFLKELIRTLANKDVTIEDILEVFKQQSSEVICEKVENSEFDYVIYFEDQSSDEFKYCFTFDDMGKYYHRFIDYNYQRLVH
jgi:hypothetical protein